MDKHVFVQLNGARKVTGVLRGFDPFMNLVLDEAVEEVSPTEKKQIGMVVWLYFELSFGVLFLLFTLKKKINCALFLFTPKE